MTNSEIKRNILDFYVQVSDVPQEGHYAYLEKQVTEFIHNRDTAIKVISFMLYYKKLKGIYYVKVRPNRSSIAKAICGLFYLHRGSKEIRERSEVLALLNEGRFREYDVRAIEIANKKLKS